MGPGTLEAVDRMIDRLCRDYPGRPPVQLISEVHGGLAWVGRLLEARTTLAQRRHLLVAGGWLWVLLACLRFDVGDRAGAQAARQAAFQLARHADHDELMAWTFELPAWWALVAGRLRTAIDLARAGQELAPSGTSAGVQLAVQEARAWSRLGDRREGEAALRRGAALLARLPAPEHPEHHFVFDPTKLVFFAATCYAWLGRSQLAEECAREVIAQCVDSAGARRWPRRVTFTQVDLGLALVRLNRIDEACHAGIQALSAGPVSRSTAWRAADLDAALMGRHADLPEARDFHDRYVLARRPL